MQFTNLINVLPLFFKIKAMNRTVPLILTLFLCHIFYAQHISEFTALPADGQDSNFNLPSTHTFQVLFDKDEFLALGGIIPEINSGPNFDFTGYVPREGSSKFGYLSINSEIAPGAVTILDIEFDDSKGLWSIDNSELVDFSFSFPTAANCSGTVTPWNTIITCEEYTSIELAANPRYPLITGTDLNGDGYDDFGWAVEIDPSTKKIINQQGGRDDKDKLWAMGNFKHENVVIRADHRTAYQGADASYRNQETREGDGYLFKFIASRRDTLSTGDLYVYRGDKISNHEWIKLKNGDPNEVGMTKEKAQSEQNSTIAQCEELGATAFGGIEDVEINPKDSLIYFAVKRESHTELGFENKGVVYRFKDSDNGIEDFELYVGGDSEYEIDLGNNNSENVVWGNGTDNLVFDDQGNLWVAQDESGSERRNYIWVIKDGHTQANPQVSIFARTPLGSEPTGLTFSPDERYIFMSIQHPSAANSSTTQTDASGKSVAFDKDVTLVIARNAHLGKDLTLKDQDIMISQYYHDEASDSKWIEIKNVSGEDIPVGTYFIDLYDSADLVNITSASPKASNSIPAMLKDEVLLFKNKEMPDFPLEIFIRDDIVTIESAVCDFDGDDVILITTTPGNRKYINRKDILGNTTATNWGQNTSLIRGGNSLELPERDFEANNWIQFDSLEEVNQADKLKNIALGTHVSGPTTWNGASWDRLHPDRTRNAIINNDYATINKNIRVYDLLVKEDVVFEFVNDADGEDYSLSIYGDLDIKGSLSIGDTESLIIKNPEASITGDIEKIERSTFRNHKDDITYWSSPVQDELIENVFEEVDETRIFYFDQTQHLDNNPAGDTYWDVWVETTGVMEVAKGYAAEGKKGTIGAHEVRFKGTPNFGSILSRILDFHDDTNENNDFNLIGNPYTAAIDIEAFLKLNAEENEVIDGTVYLWTHATAINNGKFSQSDYVTYNFVGGISSIENLEVRKNIGSGQGFFVRALKQGAVQFDTSMLLENDNNQFFKLSTNKDLHIENRIWLNLKGSDNSFKQILIGFDDMASKDLDLGYDALYLKGSQPIDFYSLLSDSDLKLAIQGREPFHEDMVIDLGFEAVNEGVEMLFEIDKIEGVLKDHDILLKDRELDVLHDLNKGPYTFNYEGKGTFKERFSLVFNSAVLHVDELQTDQDIIMHMDEGKLIIDAPWFMQQIRIYDIQGRLLHINSPNSSNTELNMELILRGNFFMVQIVNEQGNTFTRKMIRH